jgi:hypothetical protein
LVGFCIFLHVVFFLVSLTLIGFVPMLAAVFYANWAYACYLTLRQWELIVYMLTLVLGVFFGTVHIFYFDRLSLLFYIINLVVNSFAVYFLFNAFKEYRRAGGIKGKNGNAAS